VYQNSDKPAKRAWMDRQSAAAPYLGVRRHPTITFHLLTLSILALLLSACASTEPMVINPEWREQAQVRWDGIQGPLDAFVYLRNGKKYCAVRFFDFRGDSHGNRLGEKTSATAKYETVCQPREAGPKLLSTAKRTNGDVQYIIPRCHISGSCNFNDLVPAVVILGAERHAVVWRPPNVLTFLSAEVGQPFEYRNTLEIAATAVFQESAIDFAHPKLQWYQYSPRQRNATISLSELPGIEQQPVAAH